MFLIDSGCSPVEKSGYGLDTVFQVISFSANYIFLCMCVIIDSCLFFLAAEKVILDREFSPQNIHMYSRILK